MGKHEHCKEMLLLVSAYYYSRRYSQVVQWVKMQLKLEANFSPEIVMKSASQFTEVLVPLDALIGLIFSLSPREVQYP